MTFLFSYYIQATIKIRKNSYILYPFKTQPILIPKLHQISEALYVNDEYDVCQPHSNAQYSHGGQSHESPRQTYPQREHVVYQFQA